jgi:uncharacterized protein
MTFFHSFSDYNIEKFGERVWRLPLSTGYPCPNRLDGKNGCTYCSEKSFLPRYLKETDSLENQITCGIKSFGARYKVRKFYGYFQENTGTYGELSDLLSKYETVLSKPEIAGLIISTRPDFIDEKIVKELDALDKKYSKEIWLEIGLQSIYDKTLLRINRNHSYADFKNAAALVKNKSSIKLTVHLIIGLPGETPAMIKKGIKQLFVENKIDGVKFRLLEVIKETPMEKDFIENPDDFYSFEINSYAKLIAGILKEIPKEVIIMRFVNYKSLEILGKNSGRKISKNELLEEINKYLSL